MKKEGGKEFIELVLREVEGIYWREILKDSI